MTTEKTITVLQIRDEIEKKALNVKIGVHDVEKFKAFLNKKEFRYTFEEIDNRIDLENQ